MKYPAKPGRKYKSKTEARVAKRLQGMGLDYEYEPEKLPYVLHKTYTPDFFSKSSEIYLEVKGVLDQTTRSKMRAVRNQHPDKDIRFIFPKPHGKCPGIKQTHAEWAETNGFLWYSETEFKKKDLK